MNYATGDAFAKLTAIIPLVRQDEWEGGDLTVGADDYLVRAARGSAAVFPSLLLHEVSRVTKGTRIVLAAWASGPPFV